MSVYQDRKAREQADNELGQIMSVAEPFAWVDFTNATGWFGQYEIRGIVKHPDPLRNDLTAREARAEMLEQFELMLDAFAAAGWQPVDSFELTSTTRVLNFTQTLAGVLVEPSKQGTTGLNFRLKVGEAPVRDSIGDALRADAEAARAEIRAAGISCPSCGVNMADLPQVHRLVLDPEAGEVHCAGHPGADLHDYETAKAAANVGILDDLRENLDLTRPARLVYPVYGKRPR